MILGSLGIFFGLFKEKNDSIILLTSAILSSLFLLLFKLLNVKIGILFLSIFLVIISSLAISKIYNYLSLTKFIKIRKYFTWIFLLLIFSLSIIPSYFVAKNLPNYNAQIKSFTWIKNSTSLNSTIVVPLELGNILTETAERKNIIDTNFLLSRNTEERFEDVNIIYDSFSKIKALESLRKYNANYIYLDDYVKNKYNLTKIRYIDDEKCFEEIKNDVYKVIC
jgi:hypothetical protein